MTKNQTFINYTDLLKDRTGKLFKEMADDLGVSYTNFKCYRGDNPRLGDDMKFNIEIWSGGAVNASSWIDCRRENLLIQEKIAS